MSSSSITSLSPDSLMSVTRSCSRESTPAISRTVTAASSTAAHAA